MNKYIQVPIEDPLLLSALLGEVTRFTETMAGMDEFIDSGCDPQIIDAVRQLKTRDQLELSTKRRLFQCVISIESLAAEIRRLKAVRSDQEMREYFIRHGAGRELIAKLWKMPLAEVTNMCRTLLGDAKMVGRTRFPNTQVRQKIHETWYEIQNTHSELSLKLKIYKLHQQFQDLTISSVYGVTEEFTKTDVRPCDRHWRGSQVQGV